MTGSNSTPLSDCHHAPATLVGGAGDFSDREEGITMHYECSACGEMCDVTGNVKPNRNVKQQHTDNALRKEIDIIIGNPLDRKRDTDAVMQLIAEDRRRLIASIREGLPERLGEDDPHGQLDGLDVVEIYNSALDDVTDVLDAQDA